MHVFYFRDARSQPFQQQLRAADKFRLSICVAQTTAHKYISIHTRVIQGFDLQKKSQDELRKNLG